MYDTDFSPAFKVKYTIWIQDLEELLTKEDPRITGDLIWKFFRYDWGGQSSYYSVTMDNFIDYLCGYNAVWHPEDNEVKLENLDEFIFKPITDEMVPLEVLYRIVIQKMADGFLPKEFLVFINW